jgi:hypothetical protein
MLHGSWIMRQKIVADWLLIRSLYLEGMPFTELSERFGVAVGTIKARSHREKWNVVPERYKATAATPTEKSTTILHDIWADRAAKVRESEHSISERLTDYASQMSEDQLLAKIDKLKIAVDMGRRATGLDKVEKEQASVNIAVLGDISTIGSESEYYAKRSAPRVFTESVTLPESTE